MFDSLRMEGPGEDWWDKFVQDLSRLLTEKGGAKPSQRVLQPTERKKGERERTRKANE